MPRAVASCAGRRSRSPTQTVRSDPQRVGRGERGADGGDARRGGGTAPSGRSAAGDHAAYTARNSPQNPARPGSPRPAARPRRAASPAAATLAQGGPGAARSALPQRSLSPPTTKNSSAVMTPWAMLANSAACRPVRGAGGEAEGDETHVRHRRVGDQPLEVALDEADQAAPEDADDAERRRAPGRQRANPSGTAATGRRTRP